jgi:hypothetical protein
MTTSPQHETAEVSAAFLIDSKPLLDRSDFEALRHRAEEDGYLFFRSLLPQQEINKVRADVLGVVERYGWRQSGQARLGGRIDSDAINEIPASAMRLDIGVSAAAYDDIQRLQSMHGLPHHPNLLHLYQGLFAEEALVHPRHIVRMMTPHRALTPTPPHQDFPLIQGAADTWTCWFPLGDCPSDLGSLSVLRGSHRNGYLPVRHVAGAGGIEAELCPTENSWVVGDFEAGDVLTFPSYTVHKALRNHHPEQIRLSMDVRYQPISEIIEEKSLLPHCGLSWQDIYAQLALRRL